jgi:hypothetical protein
MGDVEVGSWMKPKFVGLIKRIISRQDAKAQSRIKLNIFFFFKLLRLSGFA